ncbi:hypothetical protein K4F52_007198 [Lecanicillium sp. MT-2017a]|nr:hypothetical protein K4F52_007198 [Lecanicillium sp. MT-2017a]
MASSALGLCSALALGVLSPLEHRRNPRPSFILSSYLFVSIVLDTARVRTAWLLGSMDAVAATTSASLAVKVVILALEALNKRHLLSAPYRHLSSEATSGIFSRGLFWWLATLLRSGSKRILKMHDLFAIHEKITSDKLPEELFNEWQKRNTSGRYNLAIASCLAWRIEVVKIAFPRLFLVGLNLIQPFVIQGVLENALAPNDQEARNQGYGLIGSVAIVYAGVAIVTGFYQQLTFRLMAMIRGGLIGLIYEKLSSAPIGSAAASDSAVMTLIGADVERIGETWHMLISEIWACIIQLGIAVWLLQRQLGAVCVAPVILALVSTAISFKAATFVRARQGKWLEAVQSRVNFTSHILSNMKNVKMLGLGNKLEKIIEGMRRKELDISKRFRRLSSFNIFLINMPSSLCQLITFASFSIVAQVKGEDSFTLTQAISSLSILTILMEPLSHLLHAIPTVYAALGCFERVQAFLSSDSWEDNRGVSDIARPRSTSGDIELTEQILHRQANGDVVKVVVTNATISWNGSQAVLHQISLRITADTSLTMILGPIGCGKSTLLKTMLGETVLIDGDVWTACKEIAFCDQSPWISSGTIRQCIIGQSKFSEALYNSVVYACALDVDIELLQDGHDTAVGSHGVALSGGQKQRLKPIAFFDDVVSGLDAVTKEAIMERVFGRDGLLRKFGITTVLATHSTSRLDLADQIIVLDAHGSIAQQGTPEELSMIGSSSLTTDSESSSISDKKNQEKASVDPASKAAQALEEAEQADRQIGDFAVYKYYFASLGLWSFALFAFFVLSEALFSTMQQAWLKLWSESDDGMNTGYWLGLYAAWAVLRAVLLIFAVYYLYVGVVPKSANKMHSAVLQAVFRAPMCFIAKTETGMLINRFSQDMQLVDMILPGALVSTCFFAAGCLGVSALTIVAAPYFAAVLPFMVGSLYFLQRFYLRTSRQLRLLELESKAPLFSHVIDTIRGMASIRAYGWTGSYTKECARLLSNCQKPYYLLLCIQKWLGVVLGLIVAGLATVLAALAVTLKGSTVSAGFIGIALVNMMGLSQSLANLIVFWTSLETSLGAVSRIKSFSEDTPREEDGEGEPAVEWPSCGEIVFDNWSAAYGDFAVLHGITATMQPGQTIALCGRTGSGKSSLVTSMLGMVDGTGGSIRVDGVDLATVPRETLRQRISCITQDSFLFSGSVRLNMDPTGEASDAAIEAALQKVGLWEVVERVAATAESGEGAASQLLDLEADELHLSHGQAQLFCLARALLRKSTVVLLDEPTSSVDAGTEGKIHDIVETEFRHATVIMITHRLSRIRSFDRVGVLDGGVMAEYGAPEELLADESGRLSGLCREIR